MYESKYSSFLTVLLVIIIIAIVGCLAFGGYKVYEQFNSDKDANQYVNSFIDENKNNTNDTQNTNTNTNTDTNTNVDVENNEANTNTDTNSLNQVQNTPGGTGGSSTGNSSHTYKGFKVAGTIEIPKINLSYPILDDASPAAIETAVAMLYGVGPNQVGNTLIIGHNYRNGQFFANNKNLSKGDKVYITDLSGQRLSYTIYDKFETNLEDTEFLTRNTNGAREISLQTCTDDGALRLVLLAKCDLDS